MSSDYIARLRGELLRAGASRQRRRRWMPVVQALRPLAATGAIAALATAVVLLFTGGPSDETQVRQSPDTVRLDYRVEPPDAAAQSADVLRRRLAAADIDEASVTASASGALAVTVPEGARADVQALVVPGRLELYDWERHVIRPAESELEPVEAVTKAEARKRAATEPGARVLHDASSGGWFALAGEPELTNADIAHAQPARDPSANEPVVAIEFTTDGQKAFHALTRRVAHRGSEVAAAGVPAMEAWQHFGIVLDDRVVAIPFIDFNEVPDGIDGVDGAQIQGGYTAESARLLAALLSAGPLPGAVVPDSG